MSSRTWLSYSYQNRVHLTPLSYESLEYASGFSSAQCPEGIVAISTNTLRFDFIVKAFPHLCTVNAYVFQTCRILALEKLGAVFNQGEKVVS